MKKRIQQKTALPMFVVLVCSILLIVSMFLPYLTAIDEYKELLELADQKAVVSLYEFFQMLDDGGRTARTIMGFISGLSFLAALFAVLRLPVGSLIFDIFVTAATVFVHLTFKGDNILDYYTLSIGNRLMFVACAGLLISTIWTMVSKAQAKKAYAHKKEPV